MTCDGEREVLGIWWQETEGAKFWLAVLNDLRRRGVQDVLIGCVDGLKGFPEAIEATFPQAWVQTCIVHPIRASLRYVNYRDQKKVASALRPIYTAANADAGARQARAFDAEWGKRYPPTVNAWRATGRTSWRAAWAAETPNSVCRSIFLRVFSASSTPPYPKITRTISTPQSTLSCQVQGAAWDGGAVTTICGLAPVRSCSRPALNPDRCR